MRSLRDFSYTAVYVMINEVYLEYRKSNHCILKYNNNLVYIILKTLIAAVPGIRAS